MKSDWVVHHGKRVLGASFTGFGRDHEQLQAGCNALLTMPGEEPSDSVIAIAGITGTSARPENVRGLRARVSKSNPYVRKRAIIDGCGARTLSWTPSPPSPACQFSPLRHPRAGPQLDRALTGRQLSIL
ncbi:MAG: hypothetical protein JXB85_15985 [Anaerolineales bacterium]|nr:hypothetical protein [Anaerolineales bacterium]